MIQICIYVPAIYVYMNIWYKCIYIHIYSDTLTDIAGLKRSPTREHATPHTNSSISHRVTFRLKHKWCVSHTYVCDIHNFFFVLIVYVCNTHHLCLSLNVTLWLCAWYTLFFFVLIVTHKQMMCITHIYYEHWRADKHTNTHMYVTKCVSVCTTHEY